MGILLIATPQNQTLTECRLRYLGLKDGMFLDPGHSLKQRQRVCAAHGRTRKRQCVCVFLSQNYHIKHHYFQWHAFNMNTCAYACLFWKCLNYGWSYWHPQLPSPALLSISKWGFSGSSVLGWPPMGTARWELLRHLGQHDCKRCTKISSNEQRPIFHGWKLLILVEKHGETNLPTPHLAIAWAAA